MSARESGKKKKGKQAISSQKKAAAKRSRQDKPEIVENKNSSAEKITLAIMFVVVALLLLIPPFYRGLFFPRELLIANITIFGLLIVWGIFRLFRNEKRVIGSPLDICLVVLFFAYVISLFGAANQRDAIEETLKIASYLVVYLVTIDICHYFKLSLYKPNLNIEPEDRPNKINQDVPPGLNYILHLILISTTAVTLASLGAASGIIDIPNAYLINRIFSPLTYANTAAAYIMAAYLFTLALAPLSKKWHKVLYLAPAALMLLTVILTFSRGAWLLLGPLSLLLVLVSAPGERLRSFCYLLVTAAIAVPGAFLVDPYLRENQPLQAWLLILTVVIMVLLLGWLVELYLSQSRRLKISFAVAGSAVIIIAVMIIIIIPAVGPVHLERTVEEPVQFQSAEQIVEVIEPGESYQLTLVVNAKKTTREGIEEPGYIWRLRVTGRSLEDESVNLVNYHGDATDNWEEKVFTFQIDENVSSLDVQIHNRYPGTAVTVRDVVLSAAGKDKQLGFFIHRALPERLYNRLFSLTLDQNIDRRVELFADAAKIIRDYPVTGAGGGGWNALYRSYQDQLYSSREVHNHYLQVWVEAGVIGFLAFLGIWVSFAAAFIRNCIKKRASARTWQFWTACFMPVLALGAHSAIDWNFSMAAVGILLFVLLGSGRSLDQSSWLRRGVDDIKINRKNPSYAGIAGIIIGSLLVIFTSMLLYGLHMTWRSQEHLESNNISQAMEKMQKAMQADPFRAVNFYNMSVLMDERAALVESPADVEKMISLAERAYKLEPYHPPHVIHYGSLLMRYVDVEEGLSHFDRITELRPFREDSYTNPAFTRLELAVHYLERDNRIRAQRYLFEILELEQLMEDNYGDSKPLAFFIGRANYLLGRYDTAVLYYEKIGEEDDYYEQARKELERIRTDN